MRRAILALLVGGALVAPASVYARPITECSGVYKFSNQSWYFGDDVPSGAAAFNLTTRGVRCWKARYFVETFDHTRTRDWRCRHTERGYEYMDTRCTRGSKVIRFQTAA
jgi:hypothetical protein